MKIIINESQLEKLHEFFSLEDLKGRFNYIFNLDKKKHPGANDYDRYKAILAFQKWIDLLYKYTKKEVPFEGVNGMNVATVWADSWGQNFSRPELPPARLDFTIRLFPNIDENNPPISQEKFNQEYSDFQKVFEEFSRGMGLEQIKPIDSQKVKEIKIKFNFLDIDLDRMKREMKENNNSTELQERCWKGYTQKGMKTMFGKRYPNCVKKTKK